MSGKRFRLNKLNGLNELCVFLRLRVKRFFPVNRWEQNRSLLALSIGTTAADIVAPGAGGALIRKGGKPPVRAFSGCSVGV